MSQTTVVRTNARWDKLEDSDEEIVRNEDRPATNYARGLLADPLFAEVLMRAKKTDERPPGVRFELGDHELNCLLSFITTQQHDASTDNRPRAHEIVTWYESPANRLPREEVLLALAYQMRKRCEDKADRTAAASGRGERILAMLEGALNTLAACAQEGGPRKLFTTVHRHPGSETATAYAKGEYARKLTAPYSTRMAAEVAEAARWQYGDDVIPLLPQACQDTWHACGSFLELHWKVFAIGILILGISAPHIVIVWGQTFGI